MKIPDLLNKLLPRSLEIVGLDPNAKRGNYRDWRWAERFQGIVETQKQDPTGLTTYMLFCSVWRRLLQEYEFDALDLLENEEVWDFVNSLRMALAQ